MVVRRPTVPSMPQKVTDHGFSQVPLARRGCGRVVRVDPVLTGVSSAGHP